MCILEQLQLERDSKLSEEEGDKIYWVVFICFSWLCASKQEGELASVWIHPTKRILEVLRPRFLLLSAMGSSPNNTTAVGNWLSLAPEGRALQTAPTVSTALRSQVVSPPCTQTCLTLLSKHNMAKVMRIMLQAEKWIRAVPHAVIFYYLKCQVSLH